MNNSSPRVQILATSHAADLTAPVDSRPRTDYVVLSKSLDCDILDYSAYKSLPLAGIRRRIEARMRLDLHLAIRGYRQARDCDVTVLMSERVAIPYAILARLFGTRSETVFLSMHSSETQAGVFARLGLAREITRTLSFTPAQNEFLSRRMMIRPESISYVPYAVDDIFFRPDPAARDEGYVFSAGGIPGRDYDTLIAALGRNAVDVRIVSGGRSYGRKTSGPLTGLPRAVREGGKELPLPEGEGRGEGGIQLLSGLSSIDMRALYAGASLVCLPLKADRRDAAGSTVLLEAMCMGKCVVVSNSPGIARYVKDGENAVLVPPEDPRSMRDAIVRLLADRSSRDSIGRCARKTIEEHLSLAKYVQRLKSVIMGQSVDWPML